MFHGQISLGKLGLNKTFTVRFWEPLMVKVTANVREGTWVCSISQIYRAWFLRYAYLLASLWTQVLSGSRSGPFWGWGVCFLPPQQMLSSDRVPRRIWTYLAHALSHFFPSLWEGQKVATFCGNAKSWGGDILQNFWQSTKYPSFK